MKYQPITCVWEITMGCNMRCGHCGSSCKSALPDELSTEDAYKFIDMCSEIGIKWITLSGGEPFTRKDLPLLIKYISEKGIIPNIITNGWLLNNDSAKRLKDAGVGTIAISIDGTEEIHDKIRRKDAFNRAKQSFKVLKDNGIYTGCVTTISNQNMNALRELREELIKMGINSWQLQIGLPMGNFSEHPDWLISPEHLNSLINFCSETSKEGKIAVYTADCIGYYDQELNKINQKSLGLDSPPSWDGCPAGVQSFGLLHNGDVVACTSIRNKDFIAGNIKERSLKDIWEDPKSFEWRRKLSKSSLEGDCGICKYGDKCLGGCSNTRIAINKSIYAENNYCTFNLAIKNLKKKLSQIDDEDTLYNRACLMVKSEYYQEASLILDRLIQMNPQRLEILKMKGFTEYMCSNYRLSEEANRNALKLDLNDVYATQGLGISLHAMGKEPEALALLERAAKLSEYKSQDVLNDLNFIYESLTQKVLKAIK